MHVGYFPAPILGAVFRFVWHFRHRAPRLLPERKGTEAQSNCFTATGKPLKFGRGNLRCGCAIGIRKFAFSHFPQNAMKLCAFPPIEQVKGESRMRACGSNRWRCGRVLPDG